MTFLGVEPQAGTVRRERVTVGQYADGSPVYIPVVSIGGTEPGPTAYLQAGVHGDEVSAIEACRRILASIDPATLRGNVVGIPLANVPAYLNRSRSFLFEERGPNDMNRTFPGDAGGLLTERIGATLVEEFLAHADYAVDFHSALVGCVIAPCVYVSGGPESAVRARQEQIADAFGLGLVCLQEGITQFGHTNLTRSFCATAENMGVPAVIAEFGESNRITWERVHQGVDGGLRALAAMGNLPAGAVGEAPPVDRYRKIAFVHAERGGLVRHLLPLGAPVAAGNELAVIVDPLSNEEAVATSPVDGRVLRQLMLGTCHVGAELVWVANDFIGGER